MLQGGCDSRVCKGSIGGNLRKKVHRREKCSNSNSILQCLGQGSIARLIVRCNPRCLGQVIHPGRYLPLLCSSLRGSTETLQKRWFEHRRATRTQSRDCPIADYTAGTTERLPYEYTTTAPSTPLVVKLSRRSVGEKNFLEVDLW